MYVKIILKSTLWIYSYLKINMQNNVFNANKRIINSWKWFEFFLIYIKFLYSKLLEYKKKSMKIISKYFMNNKSNNFFFQILIAYISIKK